MTTAERSPLLFHDVFDRLDVAQAALRKAPYGGLKAAKCRWADDRLVLSGSVPSFYLKQMAQTLILQVMNSAILVDNRLEVEGTVLKD